MSNVESSTVNVTPRARVFPTTHWSVVLATGKDNDSTKASAALNQLCRTYWYPLYAYVRRRGYSEHDAQDLTQGFFYLFLKRNAFGRIEKGLGTFRSYLLTSLNHFLINEHQKQQAQKRGGGQPAISLDGDEAERRYQLEPADSATPEKLFERRWATTLIQNALVRVEKDFAAKHKPGVFEQLRPFIVEGVERRPFAEIAQDLGMSEEAVKKSVQRLRQRYRQAIREEIAETVSNSADIDDELRSLLAALSD